MYCTLFSNSEFFPKDIGALLLNKLNLGTFITLSKKDYANWDPENGDLPSSFSICSIWNTKEVFRLQMKGVSSLTHAACLGTRIVDAMFPWLKIPSIPNVFKNFGFYFLYGLHMQGEDGSRLMKSLCKCVHNMARSDHGCRAVVAEVGQMDPVREAIPHWGRFSWDEDIWCIKKLQEDLENTSCDDHWLTPSSKSHSKIIFVDPRDV
ncbi:hypothetical protein F511_45064 [Dorcoceras hygrometricum]|uniref:Uncharacterized protein n=1 Tax=Dorcoceras hygrometricum TaxID=472368 RepID=A0A2Z7A498_9LAMI|nr:hypothetical protein F511_45064 [Dorcoceras hygrometricum]